MERRNPQDDRSSFDVIIRRDTEIERQNRARYEAARAARVAADAATAAAAAAAVADGEAAAARQEAAAEAAAVAQ